jgi:transketolase
MGSKYVSPANRVIGVLIGVGAPYKDVYKKYEITPEGISKRAKITVDFWKGTSNLVNVANM